MRNSQEVQWEARQLGTVLAEIENHLPLSPAAGQAFRLKTVGIGAEEWAEDTGCLQVQCSERHRLCQDKETGDLDEAWTWRWQRRGRPRGQNCHVLSASFY